MPKRPPLVGWIRRFLLQIGGANIAGADRAGQPPPSSSLAEERTPPLAPPPNGGARSGAVPNNTVSGWNI